MVDPYRDEAAPLRERLEVLRAEVTELERKLAERNALADRREEVLQEVELLELRLRSLEGARSREELCFHGPNRAIVLALGSALVLGSAFMWSRAVSSMRAPCPYEQRRDASQVPGVAAGGAVGHLASDAPLGTDLPEGDPPAPGTQMFRSPREVGTAIPYCLEHAERVSAEFKGRAVIVDVPACADVSDAPLLGAP